MNVRKNIDYTEMYAALDTAMAAETEQMELREWYLRAARQFGWSRTELSARIAEQAHLEIFLDMEQEVCDNGTNEAETISGSIRDAAAYFNRHFEQCVLLLRQCRGRPKTDPVGVRQKRLRHGPGEQGRAPEDLPRSRLHRYRLRLRLRYAN